MEEAADALNKDSMAVAKEKTKEGTDLVTKRMKIIKVADKSELGWTTVKNMRKNELAMTNADCSDQKKGLKGL